MFIGDPTLTREPVAGLEPAPGMPGSQSRGELFGARYRRLADEVLAHVRGGVAVHRDAAVEQRDAVGLTGGEHQMRAVGAADDVEQRRGLGLWPHDRDLLDRRQVE